MSSGKTHSHFTEDIVILIFGDVSRDYFMFTQNLGGYQNGQGWLYTSNSFGGTEYMQYVKIGIYDCFASLHVLTLQLSVFFVSFLSLRTFDYNHKALLLNFDGDDDFSSSFLCLRLIISRAGYS